MSEDRKYNGWTNYETWCVNLWLTNEEGSYRYWRESGAEIFKRGKNERSKYHTVSEHARYTLAQALKGEVTEGMPINEGMYCDLLGAALCEVNWDEIANAFLEECEGYEQAA